MPVASTPASETFGRPLDESLRQVDLEALANNPPKHLGQTALVEARVSKVCKKRGASLSPLAVRYRSQCLFLIMAFLCPQIVAVMW